MKQLSRLLSLAFLPLIIIAILGIVTASSAVAQQAQCVPVKQLDNLQSERVLASRGFHSYEAGPGSVDFYGRGTSAVAELDLPILLPQDPKLPTAELNAARITEVDSSLPVGQRARCWQPTEDFDVVAEFEIRFKSAETPPGVTETAFLWNAPLEEGAIEPLTAFGVTRNQLLPVLIPGYSGGYSAVAAQDFDFLGQDGYIDAAPMPVDPSNWHSVRVTMRVNEVIIEAAQGGDYQTVLVSTPPQPIKPLAFEFSLDNEVIPGVNAPVTVPDALEIESLSIRRVPAGE